MHRSVLGSSLSTQHIFRVDSEQTVELILKLCTSFRRASVIQASDPELNPIFLWEMSIEEGAALKPLGPKL